MKHERFAKNAPGDFYTTGDCLACATPENECPECLAPLDDGNNDTYFMRQPETPQEIENACSAVTSCCVDGLRYGGKNSEVIKRLGNRMEYCDNLLPGGPLRMPWENDERWKQVQARHRAWWKFWQE